MASGGKRSQEWGSGCETGISSGARDHRLEARVGLGVCGWNQEWAQDPRLEVDQTSGQVCVENQENDFGNFATLKTSNTSSKTAE